MNSKTKVSYKGIDMSVSDSKLMSQLAREKNDPRLDPNDVQLMSQLMASLQQIEDQKVKELMLGVPPAQHQMSKVGIREALRKAEESLVKASKNPLAAPPGYKAKLATAGGVLTGLLPPNPTPGGGYMGSRPKVTPKGRHWKLVEQYGLSSKDGMGNFWEGKTDAMMAALVSHQLAGREVTSEHDEKRRVWVYKVYELEDDE